MNATMLQNNMMKENLQHLFCIKTPDKEGLFVVFCLRAKLCSEGKQQSSKTNEKSTLTS